MRQYSDLTADERDLVAQALEERRGYIIENCADDIFVGEYREFATLVEDIRYQKGEGDYPPRVVVTYCNSLIPLSGDYNSNPSDLYVGVREYYTICNFRRYGWASTDEQDGEHGYGSSMIWPNGVPELMGCETTEDVITQTLAIFVAKDSSSNRSLAVNHLAKILYSSVGRKILDELLTEALACEAAHKWAARALGNDNRLAWRYQAK